ncbi:MAG: hypothetical protein ACJASY_001423 [Halioglobus sp.]|jgi:hypothetical protein
MMSFLTPATAAVRSFFHNPSCPNSYFDFVVHRIHQINLTVGFHYISELNFSVEYIVFAAISLIWASVTSPNVDQKIIIAYLFIRPTLRVRYPIPHGVHLA